MTGEPALITTGKAAEMLGVSSRTVVAYVEKGTLPAVVLPSGHRRVRREDVEALIASGDTGDAA